MPRMRFENADVSILRKMRQNAGFNAADFAVRIGISYKKVLALENGETVGRIIASKYLKFLEIDANKPSTWPEGLKIIDEGEGIRIPLES